MTTKGNVLVNDHSGHAFPIDVSRELARNGYNVVHTYSANFQSPKGNFSADHDLRTLDIIPIYYNEEFNKYSIIKRRRQELEFAQKLINEIARFKPDIVFNCNTPLFAQDRIQKYCLRHNIKFVFWCQDIYSIAITKILSNKLGFIGAIFGQYFQWLERKQLRQSDYIISITSDFSKLFSKWRIDAAKVSVIPNWAPIDQIPMTDKYNSWSTGHGLEKSFCFTYSGTLGLKHNPSLLIQLAEHFQECKDVKIVVITEGIGEGILRKEIAEKQTQNLLLLPFQKFTDIPQILGASDVLITVLEPDAGIYSVPSKMLTYMCAGKPILLSVPLDNLSSRIILEHDAGICADPDRPDDFIRFADHLYRKRHLTTTMGVNARTYAEKNFKIEDICKRFLDIIDQLSKERGPLL